MISGPGYNAIMAMHKQEIVKVGAAIVRNGLLLIVREFGESVFILPGGRPERNESELNTLTRELAEELDGSINGAPSFRFLGTFSDHAATDPTKIVTVKLYLVSMEGELNPKGEIEEVRWFDRKSDDIGILAPSIRNKILPFLTESGVV